MPFFSGEDQSIVDDTNDAGMDNNNYHGDDAIEN